MAITTGARADSTRSPRCCVTRNFAAEERLRRGGAQADEDAGLHDCELGLEPREAGGDLGPVRLLVDPPLALALPLEVLDDVRDVGVRAVDARPPRAPCRRASRRGRRTAFPPCPPGRRAAPRRTSPGAGRPSPKTVCVPRLPERARLAPGRGFPQLLQRRARRYERRRGLVEQALLSHCAFRVPRRRRYHSAPRRRGRVVRQRPAKPRTPVRFWSAPSWPPY